MKAMMQMIKMSRSGKSPLLEKEFLALYSRWHETHDMDLQKKMFMSLNRLLHTEPGFDFRQMLWNAM